MGVNNERIFKTVAHANKPKNKFFNCDSEIDLNN